MKILILALSGIGDALMFTPSIKLLRHELPNSEIDAVVMFKGVKDIYERNPHINNVIYFNFVKEGISSSLKFVLGLRGKYEASISVYPSNRKEYNVINFLIGAKLRANAKYLRYNNINFGWLNNIKVTENDLLHNVQTNIKLCEKLLNKNFIDQPSLEFPLLNSDIKYANQYLTTNKIEQNDLVIGFHPGSATLKNHINRRWEPDKFARLAELLIEKRAAKILLFGGPEEDELRAKIKNEVNSKDVLTIQAGNLAESAAIMKRCSVFVSNDSSLMHVASAMQLNVVAIIGPTNPNYIHPWNTKHKIVSLNLDCAPCFFYSPKPLACSRNDVKYKCIKELNVRMVYDAVSNIIEN